jgi:dihydrofolate synthase/folylpolyglutamate synthase
VGIPEDKDYAGVVRSMKGMANRIILTRSGNPHYHFSQKQQESLAEEDIGTIWTDSVKQALTLADSFSDPIVILGTTSVISEVEQIFQQS